MTISRYLLALFVAAAIAGAQPKNPDAALGAARHLEEAEGNYPAAIAVYKKIVAQAGKDRALAAKALVRMAECYEKLGDSDARKTYERVVREFADQREAAETAHLRLATLGKPASGSNPHLLAGTPWGYGPSADGRLLLQRTLSGELQVRDLQSGQVQLIAKGPIYSPAAISADGRQVAYSRPVSDRSELHVTNADGSGERLAWQTEKSSWLSHVEWSPDRKRILGLVRLGKDLERLVAVSSSDGSAMTLSEGQAVEDLRLSPDGTTVVYTRRVGGRSASFSLAMMRLADKREERLFEGQFVIADPLWTPDGNGILFLSDRRSPGAVVDL
jgi:hypothetical protein